MPFLTLFLWFLENEAFLPREVSTSPWLCFCPYLRHQIFHSSVILYTGSITVGYKYRHTSFHCALLGDICQVFHCKMTVFPIVINIEEDAVRRCTYSVSSGTLLNLASISKSCFPSYYRGVCLLVIFCVHQSLLVVILWGRAVLSPSFILFNYLLVWTHSYFLILRVIIQHYYYFVQIVPPLAARSSFTLASVIWHGPSFLSILLSGATKCLWFILYFSCLSSKTNHFSKQPWFLLVERGSETDIWVPDVLVVTEVL